MAATMVVKVTHSLDDPERAHIGCNVASVALASGLEVFVFLAIEGVHLARPEVPGQLVVQDAPPIGDLLELGRLGARVVLLEPGPDLVAELLLGRREGQVHAGGSIESAREIQLASSGSLCSERQRYRQARVRCGRQGSAIRSSSA